MMTFHSKKRGMGEMNGNDYHQRYMEAMKRLHGTGKRTCQHPGCGTNEGLPMPIAAPRICLHPGCSELVSRGRCEKHQKNRPERRSTTMHQKLYDSGRWRRMRLVHLRQYPLCVECEKEGKLVSASQVDHITPHNGDRRLMFDSNNFQSLCASHHSAKTMRDNMRKGKGT